MADKKSEVKFTAAEKRTAHTKGARAAYQKKPYDANPYPQGTAQHLGWSEGHNTARVAIAMFRSGE